MGTRELSQVTAIAREAGQVLLDIYATEFTVDFKGQGKSDPVTEADRRANSLIVAALREAFPDDGIIAEESELNADALTRKRIWYVDPLDGTKEFIAKNGEFSVMIGLAVEGQAQLGVVFQPSDGTLYGGVIGEGAWVERDGVRRALHVSTQADTSLLGLIVSRSHRPTNTDELRRRLGIQRELTSGSVGLKVGQIAEQHADVYVHMSDKSSAWDTCAPEALLVAAGGRFTDLAGQPIRYAKADVRTRQGILACNAAAFERVLPVVRELAAQRGLITLTPS
ncbi:MAG: 3'(2'),5'-bisphosphate nucleotidase CysQ [Polyangiales bacterium]